MTLTHERSSTQHASPCTIASVPSGHVYVRHLSPLSGGGPRRLLDPDPADPRRPAGNTWWPPSMLEPSWAEQNAFDVFHLHFGFDARTPEELDRLTRTLRDRGKPFVFTVHDLRNPHHRDRALHDEHLDVLVPAADEIVTLTQGAADAIRARWGRTAHVSPHPHVVDLQTMAVAMDVRTKWLDRPFRVGLHLKSLRPNMAPLQILPTLVSTVADLDGAVLQVNGHRDVFDPTGEHHDPELVGFLRAEERRGRVELHVHDYFSEAELWSYLASLDVSVLPYRFGTHSGWLEACRDLGATVVAPTCGFYAEQGPVLSYVHDEQSFDADSLRAAVRDAFVRRPQLGASIDERRTQRREVAAFHDDLYRSLTA
ncbi:hypothetical protein [Nocardioides currus]|uniref:Glycosyltransferase subfamily 4-like N-terminal domain-containing protein n=1 Tax=Nocardioides currus TaxID=2133958 RepID=A0A2R7YV36_9ACTN|nr:hypothetical protein [Nocardioides currus]PUA80163.1 hypothetical protein C7S10_16640 [Nocardioides currus]